MQLKRIKLENWRGVEAAEIQLDAGITIVEGDNEAGKSSFIEALNLLFRERDSTKKRELKRVTPKGVDAGSSVEVEFTSGDYHLTYSKTFNKRTATTLFVHKPSQVQLVGAEAHERVLEILDDTIDFSLWQAIQLEQGGEFSQVSFKNSDSLAQALDNAAGGIGAGEGESALLAEAKKEYLKYFTERTGKETGELATLREQAQALEQSGDQLAGSLAELDTFIDSSARITRELTGLADRLPAMEVHMAGLDKQQAEFAMQQTQLAAAQAQVSSHQLRVVEVDRQIAERVDLKKESRELADAIAGNDKAKQELEKLCIKSNDTLLKVTAERDELLKKRQNVETKLRSIDTLIELRDQKARLQILESQHKQIHSAHEKLNELESEIAAIRVDDVSINRIQALEQQRRDQEMQIGGQSASVKVQFLKDTEVDNGDTRRSYSAGDELKTDTSHAATLKLNDDLKIEILPAADNYELTLELQKTVESLNELLSACGVKTPVEAASAHRKRDSLTARLREMRQNHKELSKDQSPEALLQVIKTQKLTIANLQNSFQSKIDDSTGSNNLELTRQEKWQQAEALAQSINKARDLRDQSLQHCADTKAKLDVCIESRDVNQQMFEKINAKVTSLENDISADALESQRLELNTTLAEAEKSLAGAKADVQKSSAGGLELLVKNARQSLQRAQSEQRDFELQQADVKARLDQMQSEGLHEKHQAVLAEHSDNESRLKQLDRRARAAAKLWKTLCHHQREAQLSYARPLADRVAAMGMVIFGDDFSVELSESLNIVSRTLHGITVPFDDLSGGAREQLGILLRLAAAQLVSKSEAMPLILDDTLGHTDTKRLETMGAILNNAAQTAQIIVMTCYPARYSYVGSAKVVRLHQQQDSLFETSN